MKKNNWKMDGSGCFVIQQECIVCGQEFEYVCPRDYYSELWHNHFGCCTHNCMEHEFDYDGFKNDVQRRIRTEHGWKVWVEKVAMVKFPQYHTPEVLFEMQYKTAKSIGIERELIEAGFDIEFSKKMAWGDINKTEINSSRSR